MSSTNAKQVIAAAMANPLVLKTANARTTEKYVGLTVRFGQWFGRDKVSFKIYFIGDDLVDGECIYQDVFDVSLEYQKCDERILTDKFAAEAELSLEYDPPLDPLLGMSPRPNGEYDKLRSVVTSPFGTRRSICAPMPRFREFVAWVP